MLNFEEFSNEIKEKFEKACTERIEGVQAVLIDIKENNEECKGLTLEDGQTQAPVINVDKLYDSYLESEDMLSMDNIRNLADNYLEEYELSFEREEEPYPLDTLYLEVINEKHNEGLLESLAHVHLDHDMYVIFKLKEGEVKDGFRPHIITKDELQRFGMDEERLYELALANSNRIQKTVIVSPDVIPQGKLVEGMDDKELKEYLQVAGSSVIITNITMERGAGAVLFEQDNPLERIAEASGHNLFVIPTSIHEMLVIPDDGFLNRKEVEEVFKEMIAEMPAHERLSEQVFQYEKDNKMLHLSVNKAVQIGKTEQRAVHLQR